MAELALDDVDRDPFAGELDRVGVAELVGRESPADAGVSRQLAQFGSAPRWLTTAGRGWGRR